MNLKPKILLICSDETLAEKITSSRGVSGMDFYRVDGFDKAAECLDLYEPDVLVAAIDFPESETVFEFLKTFKREHANPFIAVGNSSDVFDIVLSLEMGADDYIQIPFDQREFAARLKVAVRYYKSILSGGVKHGASKSAQPEKKVISFNGLVVDKEKYVVTVDGQKIAMPPKELELLYYLASEPNTVFSRKTLLERIWGYEFFGSSRTVDVHIKRLRDKLSQGGHSWSIITVWGVGYKFLTESE